MGAATGAAHPHVTALHALADEYELWAHEQTARASAEAFGAELAFPTTSTTTW